MADELHGYGVQLQMGDGGSPEVFAPVARVRKLNGPGVSVDTSDVTTLDSGKWKEFLDGLIDGGEVSFNIVFNPQEATHGPQSGLWKKMTEGGRHNFKVVFPDTSTLAFAALVTKFTPDYDETKEIAADITLKVSGEITFTLPA